MLINAQKWKRILVVVDAEHLDAASEKESTLLARAIDLANAINAEVELFHACDDASLEQKLFSSDEGVLKERTRIADHYATRMAELVNNVSSSAENLRYEVRWDSPEVDAILRRIVEFEPDIVLLPSSGHEYLFGAVSHVEWDLIRQSPVPVWFVNEDVSSVKRIVTAIGTISIDDDIISASDYDVARVAETVAQAFDAETFPVHAFKVPPSVTNPNAYKPIITTAEAPSLQEMDDRASASQEIAKEHGKQIAAFLGLFKIDPARLRVAQGEPAQVVAETAKKINAELIVMGARNLTRWQRFAKRVTAEPVLASAPGDVIFAKEAEYPEPPKPTEEPVSGSPAIDIESAITNPEAVFESPAAVAAKKTLSVDLRLHILEAWEQDVRAALRMQDEGGEPMPVDAERLAQINDARESIETERRET